MPKTFSDIAFADYLPSPPSPAQPFPGEDHPKQRKEDAVMTITIDFNATDMALIEKQATASNTTAEEFIRNASAKAARNAEYLSMLGRAFKQMEEGRCQRREMIEVD